MFHNCNIIEEESCDTGVNSCRSGTWLFPKVSLEPKLSGESYQIIGSRRTKKDYPICEQGRNPRVLHTKTFFFFQQIIILNMSIDIKIHFNRQLN